MKKAIIAFFIALFTSCNFSDEVRILSGGWGFYVEGHSQRVLTNYSNFIPCEVTEYGYDNDFIIAAQKPTENCFYRKDTFAYKVGLKQTYYWIIYHPEKMLLGPMTEPEFKIARKKYNVPDDLELEPVY